MRAWTAIDEERFEGLVGGVIGAGALVAALAYDANPVWPVLAVIALLALPHWRGRSLAKQLERAEPAWEGLVSHGRLTTLLRRFAPEILTPVLAVIMLPTAPIITALLGAVMLASAIDSFRRVRILARWQQANGGRVLRTRSWGEAERLYVAH
jgi:hypothetical protein